jgi:hypothetical protein
MTRQLIHEWRLFPEQVPVLANDRGVDVIIAGVGGGKTAIAALKLLFWGLRHARRRGGGPTEGLVLGENYKQVREVLLEEVLKHCRRLGRLDEKGAFVPIPEGAIVKRALGGNNPLIELVTGVTFRGFSSTDLDRLRSFAFDFAWLDEAEYQTEESLMMAINRQRAAECVRAIVTSSPAAADVGWLYNAISGKVPQWEPIRQASAFRVHRWGSASNPHLTAEALAQVRAGIEATRPGFAAQELDGLFLGTDEAPAAGPFDWSKGFTGKLELRGDEARAAVLGVDLGQKRDFTALVVLSARGVVLEIEHFKESTLAIAPSDFFPFVEDRCVELVKKHHIPLVKIDTAWTGASQAQFLERRFLRSSLVGPRVEGFRTDSQTRKDEALEALGVALSRAAVRVPTSWAGPDGVEHPVEHVRELRLELAKLQVEQRGLKRHFKHPDGGHDDLTVALALAWQGLSVKRPPFDISKWRQPNVGRRTF